nr:MAG TPA: hypothetical protein [Caudoviricetes sp.]
MFSFFIFLIKTAKVVIIWQLANLSISKSLIISY